MSLLNFVVIQHRLVVEQVPWLKEMVPGLAGFGLLFLMLYVPFAGLVGWWDVRNTQDFKIMTKANPWTQDLVRALIALSENEPEKVREVLKKWG